MKESKFQKDLKHKLHKLFPGCIVTKNDPGDIQGFPDLSIFFKDKYAMLEVKRSKEAPHRPNQDHYIDKIKKMSYASFIYPENEEDVLHELEQFFQR